MRASCLLTLFVLPVAVQGASLPAPRGLDKLRAYAGNWDTQVTHLDTPYGKAGSEHHRLVNDCWRSTLFYVCQQSLDGAPKALLVFTYDPAQDRYASYPVVPGSDAAHAGVLIIQGRDWIFPWDDTEQGKTTHFRVVNTWSSPDSIEFRQEYSADGEHWITMAKGHETRTRN